MKLHTKLYLFFAGIVLLPLLVVTVAASAVLGRSGSETYEGRLQSGLAAASAIVSAQAQVLSGDFQVVLGRADSGTLLSGDETRRALVINSILAETGAVGLVIQDPSGAVVTRAGTAFSAAGAPADGTLSSSSTGTGEAGDATPLIVSTARLARPDGALWRLTLLHSFNIEALEKVFDAQGLEWGLLVDGVVKSGSLPAGDEIQDSAGEPVQIIDHTAPMGALPVTIGGQEKLASALLLPRDITEGQTSLFAAVPAATVGAASRQALLVGLALMASVALTAGVLGLLLARNITRPLRQLTSAAAAGIEGDLGRQVEVTSHDEVGNLASSFGLMQTSLRDYIAELEESRTQLLLALSYAGEILGSTSDRARMMKTTAEAARLATSASGIWVDLFASKRSPVRSGVFTGVPPHFFDDAFKRQVTMLAERVAADNTSAGEVLDFGPNYEAVAYPLVHERQALGAMVAVFGRGQSTKESRHILGSLAAQAASAVENVNFGEMQQLLATTDPMTSLFNFRYLCNYLDKEISKSRRYGRQLSIAILDLDDFKTVNDTYGHQAGDDLLRAVGEVLTGQVRASDIVARYGGEEFSVVFPETSKADAMKVVEKLRSGIEQIRLPAYPEVRITTSIGVSSFPVDGGDKTDLLVSADAALYQAKESGKNRSFSA